MQRNSTASIFGQLNPFKKLTLALALSACLRGVRADCMDDTACSAVAIIGIVAAAFAVFACIDRGIVAAARAAREEVEEDNGYQRLEDGQAITITTPSAPPIAVELAQPEAVEGAVNKLSPNRLAG